MITLPTEQHETSADSSVVVAAPLLLDEPAVTPAEDVADPSITVDEAVEPVPAPSTKTDDKIHCRACSHWVTRGRWAIQRGGSFEHRFRNPAGWSFQVGCYAKAPGASAAGQPTAEHSWFAGYLWRYAVCAGCGTHLGWWYLGSDTFAGLIVTRLR